MSRLGIAGTECPDFETLMDTMNDLRPGTPVLLDKMSSGGWSVLNFLPHFSQIRNRTTSSSCDVYVHTTFVSSDPQAGQGIPLSRFISIQPVRSSAHSLGFG